jgi:hypothetical protein
MDLENFENDIVLAHLNKNLNKNIYLKTILEIFQKYSKNIPLKTVT